MEFPILHYIGMFKRWRRKSLLLVDEGFRILDKSLPNNKSNKIIYPLKGAIVLENLKNNKALEINLRKGRIIIQAFSPKEKQIIRDKLRQHISKINENNCFSQEFEDYLSEINKLEEENPSDDMFKSIQQSISLVINFFLELNQKIDELKNVIDGSKLGKNLKSNLNDCHNKLTLVETKMKAKFDELVKTIYDYHDFLEPIMTDEFTKSISEKFYNSESEQKKRRVSNSAKMGNKFSIDSSDSENEINFEEKKENPEKKELIIFKEDPIYNFEKRTKLDKKIEVNNNMIPEIVKLISSGQKVLPIQFNEPLNTLQKECERFIFCYLLDKASEEKKPEMKFALISAFITAEMSMSIGRILKPMIPLVGETYEYVDNKLQFRFFAEEVQRLPGHISAFIVEGKKWKYWGDNRNKASFRFFQGAYGVDFGNKIHLELVNEDKECKLDRFIFNRPSALLKGILTNKLHYDYNGTINIESPDYSNIFCQIEFISENEEGVIKGKIVKGENIEDGEIIYNIGGNWKKEIYITDKDDNNKIILFTVNEEEFFKNSVEKYIIPQYCCNLNYLPDELKEVIPVSDTRNRPDQKEYEIGSTEKSQEIKAILEEMQVYKQDILDKSNKEHQPIYFSNEYNEVSKDFVFTYKGGYWEDRKKKKFNKLKNVFDSTEFLKSKEKKEDKDNKNNKDKKDNKENKNNKDNKDNKDNKEKKDDKDNKDNKEKKDNKDNKDNKEKKEN